MNESPLIHSSASMPPRRNKPSSEPLVVPVVARLSRLKAPMRTALAPAGELTSAGLMMSGSSTERIRSLEMQAVASTATAAAAIRKRRGFSNCICTGILEAKVETEGDISRWRKRLEGRRRVAGGAVGFRIDAGVLRPQDAEIAHRAREGERAPAEVLRSPPLGGVEG